MLLSGRAAPFVFVLTTAIVVLRYRQYRHSIRWRAKAPNRSFLDHEFGLSLAEDDGDGNHQQQKAVEDVGHYPHRAALLGYG